MSDIVEWLGDPELYPNILVTSIYRRIYRKSEIHNVDTNLRKHMIHRINNCPEDIRLSTLLDPKQVIIMINPDETTWNSDNIIKAKNFLLGCMNKTLTKEDILKYGIGEQSNNNNERYGMLACYKYCSMNGINMEQGISLDTLYNMTRMLLFDKMTLITHLMSIPNGDIINTIISYGITGYNVRMERLVLMSKLVDDILYKDMEREYYIAWASLRLDINLYDFQMPYIAITLFPEYNKYEPHVHTISLKDRFDPRLPVECYKISTLRHLVVLEGLDTPLGQDKKLYHDFLMGQRNKPTFYKGRHKSAINDSSPIYFNDISDIKEEHLISYGTYDNMTCIPILELEENFTHYMDLVDMDGHQLSQVSINKLYRLLQSSTDDTVVQVKNTITNIKERISKFNEVDRNFIAYYKNHPNKDIIRAFLLQCLQCSMYMRGWDGTSPHSYPLDGNSNLREDTIFTNVSVILAQIKEFEDKEPQIYENIMTLDLYAIDHKYTANQSISWRHDRKGVLKTKFSVISNNNPDNIEACIRTNSNWILGTVLHYSDLIGISYGFNTSNVRFIF